jgi:hypothetical protein
VGAVGVVGAGEAGKAVGVAAAAVVAVHTAVLGMVAERVLSQEQGGKETTLEH